MDLYYLNRGECFNTDNDVLCINESSEVYYIETDENRYVAWNGYNETYNIELEGKDCLINQLNYYSVIDGSLVLVENEIYDLTTGNLLSKNDDVVVRKLSELLNIKGNQEYLFTLDDIRSFLTDEKTKLNEKSKQKKKSK